MNKKYLFTRQVFESNAHIQIKRKRGIFHAFYNTHLTGFLYSLKVFISILLYVYRFTNKYIFTFSIGGELYKLILIEIIFFA